ncbi:MAG: hypothetical protein HPY82_05740 [Gammaproteobacteria bacterium]|nr:hypothetical protein [Gammaproteobacteria bacterium]
MSSESMNKRRFDKHEYAALHRLKNNSEDFKLIVAALQRRYSGYLMDLSAADPDKPGKVGQQQGRCRELADILESIDGTEIVLNQSRP